MAKNYIGKGDVITVPSPAAVTSGSGVLIGVLFGVAQADAAEDDDLVLQRVGIFSLPAAPADAIAVGDALYWDATAGTITTDSDGNPLIGAALGAKAAAAAGNVEVLLTGASTVAVEDTGPG